MFVHGNEGEHKLLYPVAMCYYQAGGLESRLLQESGPPLVGLLKDLFFIHRFDSK